MELEDNENFTDYNHCDFFPTDPNDEEQWVGHFSYYLNGPIMSIIILIGLIGNILSFLTLSRPKHRLPQINQYLIGLCIWDTSLIVTAFFVYNLPYLIYGTIVTHGPYVLIYPLFYTFSWASYMGSIWMVMMSAIDRYFALCHPLTHRVHIAGESRTKTILIICSLSCLIFNAPKYLELSVDYCYDIERSKWTPSLTSSGLRGHQIYWICYKIIGGLLFFSALPFTALTYLSARVSYEVRRLTSTQTVKTENCPIRKTDCPSPSPTPSSQTKPTPTVACDPVDMDRHVSFNQIVVEYEQKRARSGSGQKKYQNTPISACMLRRHSVTPQRLKGSDPQQALNFMLVAILVKFLICHSLPTVLDIWESSMGQDGRFFGPVIDTLVDTSNFLVVANSSINIFIYIRCSRQFRGDAKKILSKLFSFLVDDSSTAEMEDTPGGYSYVQRGSVVGTGAGGNYRNYATPSPLMRTRLIMTPGSPSVSWT